MENFLKKFIKMTKEILYTCAAGLDEKEKGWYTVSIMSAPKAAGCGS